MRCDKCGGPITNSLTTINGINLCEKCAREAGVGGIGDAFSATAGIFGQSFPFFSDFQNALIGGMGDIEFANNKLRCQRCGSTLRDIETNMHLGCIECYNIFKEALMKDILKRQGSNEYYGRKPGEELPFRVTGEFASDTLEINEETELSDVEGTAPDGAEGKVSGVSVKSEANAEEAKDLRDMDLTLIPTENLQEAMRVAVEHEDYSFAAKLRDEINRRKDEE